MALRPLLVFVIMSGQLYPLSSDSKSDSEPDESESLKISWKKGGRGGYEIVPLSASSHQGGGSTEKISYIIRGARKNISGKNYDPHSSPNP